MVQMSINTDWYAKTKPEVAVLKSNKYVE